MKKSEKMVTLITLFEQKKGRKSGGEHNIDVNNPKNATEKRLLEKALDLLSPDERSNFLSAEKENPFKINPDYENLIKKLEPVKKSKNLKDVDFAIGKIYKSLQNYYLLYGQNRAERFCDPKKLEKSKNISYVVLYGFVEKNIFQLTKLNNSLVDLKHELSKN